MQSIFYTRHGESEANSRHLVAGTLDSPLTDKGRQQAHDLADWISEQGMNFDAIISSPLNRCIDTAKIVARKLHYPADNIIYLETLRERDCGEFEGKSIDDYFETPESIAIKDFKVESLDELYERSKEVIQELQQHYQDKNILIVSHNGIGKMLRIVTEGRDASEFDKTVSIPPATIMRLF